MLRKYRFIVLPCDQKRTSQGICVFLSHHLWADLPQFHDPSLYLLRVSHSITAQNTILSIDCCGRMWYTHYCWPPLPLSMTYHCHIHRCNLDMYHRLCPTSNYFHSYKQHNPCYQHYLDRKHNYYLRSREIMHLGSVSLCVCLFVSTLMTEPFNLWPWSFILGSTLTLAYLLFHPSQGQGWIPCQKFRLWVNQFSRENTTGRQTDIHNQVCYLPASQSYGLNKDHFSQRLTF